MNIQDVVSSYLTNPWLWAFALSVCRMVILGMTQYRINSRHTKILNNRNEPYSAFLAPGIWAILTMIGMTIAVQKEMPDWYLRHTAFGTTAVALYEVYAGLFVMTCLFFAVYSMIVILIASCKLKELQFKLKDNTGNEDDKDDDNA